MQLPNVTKRGELLGKGYESLIYALEDPKWVLDLQSKSDTFNKPKDVKILDYERSFLRVKKLTEEQNTLKPIFKGRLVERIYTDSNGNLMKIDGEIYFLRKRVYGSTVHDLVTHVTGKLDEVLLTNVNEFANILYASKKAFVLMGIPIDFHYSNIVLEEGKKGQRAMILDWGHPLEEQEKISISSNKESNMQLLERVFDRLEKIDAMDKILNVTNSLRLELYKEYDFTEEQYIKAKERLNELGKKVGYSQEDYKKSKVKRIFKLGLYRFSTEHKKSLLSVKEVQEIINKVFEEKNISNMKNEILKKVSENADKTFSYEEWTDLVFG